MTKIDLEFECTAPDGKCVWKETPGECVNSDDNDESWVCWYLKALCVECVKKAKAVKQK